MTDDDEQALFASVDEACETFGFDDATKDQIRRDMALTAPHGADEPLH